jgi:hypothetical protein
MPMKSVSFTTSGVENFLEGVMKIDTQDFLSKMEGFAIQGVVGTFTAHHHIHYLQLTDIQQVQPKTINSAFPLFVQTFAAQSQTACVR